MIECSESDVIEHMIRFAKRRTDGWDCSNKGTAKPNLHQIEELLEEFCQKFKLHMRYYLANNYLTCTKKQPEEADYLEGKQSVARL